MTVQTTSMSNGYIGDGVATQFDFNFVTLDADTIFVQYDRIDQGSTFTTTLNADQGAAPGGNVVMDTAPGSGVDVRIHRQVVPVQLTAYDPFGPFPSKDVERNLDDLTLMAQQISAQQISAVWWIEARYEGTISRNNHDIPLPISPEAIDLYLGGVRQSSADYEIVASGVILTSASPATLPYAITAYTVAP